MSPKTLKFWLFCGRPPALKGNEESKDKSNEKSILKSNLKGILKSSLKSDQKILEIISKKSDITIPEIAEKIGLTVVGVKKNIKKLKEQNKIRRVGADKGGHWEIIP